MRAFAGIELSPAWRDALGIACDTVRRLDPAWRDDKWVPLDNLHVTLAFFGDIEPECAEALVAEFRPLLAEMPEFDLPLDRAAKATPGPSRARMLWGVAGDPEGSCAALAAAVETVAGRYGVESQDRTFRPHVTLVRARRPHRVSVAALAEADSAACGALGDTPLSVSAVTVFQSVLTRTHPVYERIDVVPLACVR